MKTFKIKLFMDDGNEFEYMSQTSVDMTTDEMAAKMVNLTKWLILKQPDGSAGIINARHIKWFTVKEVEREADRA